MTYRSIALTFSLLIYLVPCAQAAHTPCPSFNHVLKSGLKQVLWLSLTGKFDQLKDFRYPMDNGKQGKLSNFHMAHKEKYRDLYKKYGAGALFKTFGHELLTLNLQKEMPGVRKDKRTCRYKVTLEALVKKGSGRVDVIKKAMPEATKLFPMQATSLRVDLVTP